MMIPYRHYPSWVPKPPLVVVFLPIVPIPHCHHDILRVDLLLILTKVKIIMHCMKKLRKTNHRFHERLAMNPIQLKIP